MICSQSAFFYAFLYAFLAFFDGLFGWCLILGIALPCQLFGYLFFWFVFKVFCAWIELWWASLEKDLHGNHGGRFAMRA